VLEQRAHDRDRFRRVSRRNGRLTSVIGTKQTFRGALAMSAFGGKADKRRWGGFKSLGQTWIVLNQVVLYFSRVSERLTRVGLPEFVKRCQEAFCQSDPERAHLSIENNRLDRYGYARQDFANLDRRVRLMQVAHGAGENSRHAGTAAPRPATEVDRHRMLLGKFKQRRIAAAPRSGHT